MEPSPFRIGKLLSDLLDRPIQIARSDNAVFASSCVHGTYRVEPGNALVVARFDLSLLATLAGILIGMPQKTVESQIENGILDEDMTDASREVMNVFSSVVVEEGRAILKSVFWRKIDLPPDAQALLQTASLGRYEFRASISGKTAGCLELVTTL